MKDRRVAVATYRALPQLDSEGPQLLAALEQAGLKPEVQVWDAPEIDWSSYDLVLVRSTWDYTLRRPEFLAWAAGCPRTANPAAVLSWNTDKRYLGELTVAGLPVVPTFFAARSHHVQEMVDRLHRQGRAVMLQPYLPRVETDGETALVYLGGGYSHAVRKAALLTEQGERAPLFGDDALGVLTPATATAEQLAVARAALAAVPGGPGRLSYARVDLVPDDQGRPTLLELELTEPSLFLHHASGTALQRFARHVAVSAGA